MRKRKLKPWFSGVLIGVGCITLLGGLYFSDVIFGNSSGFNGEDGFSFVGKLIFDDSVPVVETKNEIVMKPFSQPNIDIIKEFYEHTAESTNQQKSLIYIDGTYLQNTGIVYGSSEQFDVVAILSGTVAKVRDDELLGKVIEIQHANSVVSIYECLDSVNIKEGDLVSQGQVIAKTGATKITADAEYNLLFELIIHGQTVNPANYYEKSVNEIQG